MVATSCLRIPPALRFVVVVLGFAALLGFAGAGSAHAAFGVRWSLPGQTRLGAGIFTQQSQIELLTSDGSSARIINATTGHVTAALPASFVVAGWQRIITDVDGDGFSDIVAWTNLPGGGSQVELYGHSGTAVVRKWSVARPSAITAIHLVALRQDPQMQLAIETSSAAGCGLDVLEAVTGALRYSLPPATAASTHFEYGTWDFAGSPAVLFAALDAAGLGTYRMIQESGGTVAPAWTTTGRLLGAATIASALRLDLLMADGSGAGQLVNAATGAQVCALPGAFVTDGSLPFWLVDTDYDGVSEVFQGSNLFGWTGSSVQLRWFSNLGSYGATEEVVQQDLDNDPSTVELVCRCAGSLVILRGATGTQLYSSDAVALYHASRIWFADVTPSRIGTELLAYFPASAFGSAKFAVVGAISPGAIAQWYTRDAGELAELGTYRVSSELDVVERSGHVYDAGAGGLVGTVPAPFSSDPGASLIPTDLDLDGNPDFVQLASPATGSGGLAAFGWNGSAFATKWQSAQPYAPNAAATFGFFTSPTQAQFGLLGEGRIVLLSGTGGAVLYDSESDGFTTVTGPEAGGWENMSDEQDILFEGGGAARPQGIYLLSDATGTLAVGAPPPPSILQLGAAPNPFAGVSRIRFALPRAGEADVRVFDAGGRLVRTLARGRFEAGAHAEDWDGRDAQGHSVPAGTYFVRLASAAETVTRRVVRMR